MTLASASAEVKLWRQDDDKEVVNFSPHDGKINCVRWNHNNQVLVSCGNDGSVVLSHQTGRMLGRLPTEPNEPAVHSLVFSAGSRYLCSGGDSRAVDVWDLKDKKKTRTFTSHKGSITCIAFAKDDKKVASGSMSGEVLVHSVVTGTTICRLNCDKEPVRDLQYSPFRPSILATGGDDSCLRLWDTNTSTLLQNFSRKHHAPINQVVYSPVGSLLCSAGLDKKIIFYDVDTNRSVKQIITDYPLTCMTFHDDGAHFVVGTMQGHLMEYDFRRSDRPIRVINNAHSSTVNCVRFQYSTNSSKRPSMQQAAASNLTKPPQPQNDLFSPIKTATAEAVNTPPLSSKYAYELNEAEDASRHQPIPIQMSPDASPRPGRPGPGPGPHTGPGPGPAQTDSNPHTAPHMSPIPTTPLREHWNTRGSGGSSVDASYPPIGAGASPLVGARDPRGGGGDSAGLTPLTPHQQHQQAALIKSIVEDVVGSCRASLKEDISNLHLELLRQFHVQQVEMRELLENFTSRYELLVREVQELRLNYEDLKHAY